MTARKAQRWRQGLPDLMPISREIHRAAFHGDAMPKGWRVEWAGFMRGALGLCIYSERRILLSAGDFRQRKPRTHLQHYTDGTSKLITFEPTYHDPVRTLVHEFIHMRGELRHGKMPALA